MLIHTEQFEGFTVEFYAHPEHDSPRGQFQNEDGSDDEETIAKIFNGDYAWFSAQVTASKEGITLGSDWLGSCCYETEAAFVTEDGYYPDMRRAAVDEAKAMIAKFCASAT